MKVIVNNHTPLTVEDESGNVLYQWLPKEKYINVTEIKMKPISDKDKDYIIDQLRQARFTY
jgi:hypothetical protein